MLTLIHCITTQLPSGVDHGAFYRADFRGHAKVVVVQRAVTEEDVAGCRTTQGVKVGDMRWFIYESAWVPDSHTGRDREIGYLDCVAKGTRLHLDGAWAEYGGFGMRQIAPNFEARCALVDYLASWAGGRPSDEA